MRSRAAGPADAVILQDLIQRLIEGFGRIPYEQREVIILHLYSKMRFRQIAQSQGISLNTIQSRYRYGLEKLRAVLNSEWKPCNKKEK